MGLREVNMKKRNRFLSRFSIFDLVIIAILSALGVATKPIIVPLVHIITGPLFIPGGAIAGGFYMMWIVLGAGFVKKTGAATLIGLVQGILVISTGIIGTHGIMSIASYTIPGIVVDIVFLFSKDKNFNILHYVFGTMAANVSGTLIANILFFRLPKVTVVLILASAALSGALGGIIVWGINQGLEKIDINL